VGRARGFDLAGYTAARASALAILASALEGKDHSALFKVTETYRAGADGRDKTEHLLRTLYSLLEDLLWLLEGTPELVRNTDIARDLGKLAQAVSFAWVQEASERLAEVERGMRRNLLRSLSLDAFATSLEGT
jgi:DNA polymerase-3 subunit delta'